MTAPLSLAALAAAKPEAFDRVLHSCRFEGFAASAYGGEAILALFARAPAEIETPVALVGDGLAVLIGRDGQGERSALVADLNAGWITRLWRLGAASALEGPPSSSTSVPADLDLDQRGGRLAFSPAEHPALSPAHAERIAALGEHWLKAQPPEVVGRLARARPMVLRAASQGARTAALFRIEGATAHGLGGFYAAAIWDGDGSEAQLAVDLAGREASWAAPWRPLLRREAAA